MIFIILGLCLVAEAEETVERWKGRFTISGFSFKGAVPGELILGSDQEMQLSLLRPSGMPIMSVTVLKEEVCFSFEMDDLQYRGSHEEFLELSDGGLPADQLQLLFRPDVSKTPQGWDWLSTPRHPIRSLEIVVKEQPFLRAEYKKWTGEGPRKVYLHLDPNTWKMRANLQQMDRINWTPTCEVSENMTVKPLSEMLRALPPNR